MCYVRAEGLAARLWGRAGAGRKKSQRPIDVVYLSGYYINRTASPLALGGVLVGRPELVGRIAERILRGLAEGRWPEGSALPSCRHLAAEFGVSFHTVMAATHRLAQSGLLATEPRRPTMVPEGVRGRARGLLVQRMPRSDRRLAILITEFWNPPQRNAFYGTLVASIQQEASRRSQSVVVVPLPMGQQAETAQRVISGAYDAAVFVAFTAEYMASIIPFHESGFPLLVFNRRIPGYELPTVTLDDYGTSRRLVQRLAELGHRNLCLVGSYVTHSEVNPHPVKGRGRAVGWTDALAELGLMEHCVLPVYVPWDYDPGIYEGMFRRLLRSSERPTVIVFGNNPLARRFLADEEFSRLAVPGDISLATFEPAINMPRSADRPPLTSIHIDPQRTAQCILETLDQMVAGSTEVQTIRVPLTIDMTDSIGLPNC